MKKFASLSLLMSCMGILGAQTVTAYNDTNCLCTPNNSTLSCTKQSVQTYYYGTEDNEGSFHPTGQAPAQVGAATQIPVTNVLRDTMVPGITVSLNANSQGSSDATLADLGNPPYAIVSVTIPEAPFPAAVPLPASAINPDTCQVNAPSALASVRIGKNTK